MKRIEYIEFDEFKKVYSAAKDDKELKLAMLLGFGSGLRISEIVGLKKQISVCCREDVDIRRIKEEGKTMKHYFCSKCNKELKQKEIRRHLTEYMIPPLTVDKIDLQKHQIRIDVAKGGKWRVTITPPLLKEDSLKMLPLKVPRRTIQNRFKVLVKRTLGKNMSFHILRHGFGNYQANVLKLPLPIVQQMMGHTRLDTTGVYTKVNPEFAISEAWKAMGGQ